MPTVEFSPMVDSDPAQACPTTLTPVFYGQGRESDPFAMLTVRDNDGSVVGRYLLALNGRSHSVVLLDRSKPVMSHLDKLAMAKRAETTVDAQTV